MESAIRILIAEDSQLDRWFHERAFKQACPDAVLIFVRDGKELLEYLKGENPRLSAAVIDLKLIRMNGGDVLKKIRNPGGLGIPVVVLSVYGQAPDVEKLRDLGVSVMQKPSDLDDWKKLADDIRALLRAQTSMAS